MAVDRVGGLIRDRHHISYSVPHTLGGGGNCVVSVLHCTNQRRRSEFVRISNTPGRFFYLPDRKQCRKLGFVIPIAESLPTDPGHFRAAAPLLQQEPSSGTVLVFTSPGSDKPKHLRRTYLLLYFEEAPSVSLFALYSPSCSIFVVHHIGELVESVRTRLCLSIEQPSIAICWKCELLGWVL